MLILQKKQKADFDDKLKYLNEKVTSNRTKHVEVPNEYRILNRGNLQECQKKGAKNLNTSENYFSPKLISNRHF